MPSATAACNSKSLAALNVAHFGPATAMPETRSSFSSIRFAIIKRAEPIGAVLNAQAVFDRACIAPSSNAKSFCTVLLAKPQCNNKIAAA